MNLEDPVANQSFTTHTIEDIDANSSLEPTFEFEKINDDNVNLACDEDEAKDLSIMGKVFNTPKDAYTFYNQYAFLHGFGTKKCRRDLRTGCQAMLRISKGKDGEWFVDVFNDKHNHELSITPTKVMKHRSHGKIHRSMACKSLMVELGQSGLRPCQIKKAINVMKTPYNVDVTSKQCTDVLFEQRKQYKVDSRRVAEEDEDFKTMNSSLMLSSVHPIEAKAGQFYTRKMFEVFKKEWIEANCNLTHETLSKTPEEIKYRVGQLNIEKRHWRIVSFHFVDHVNVTCSYAKYETYGILCKHSLYVMKKRHVETLPSPFILPRWTLSVRYKVGNSSIRLDEMNSENGLSALTLWCVRSNCDKAIEQASDSPTEIEKFNSSVIKFLEDQRIRKNSKEFETVSLDPYRGISQIDMIPQLSVRDPVAPKNTKGRPKNATRIKSSLENMKKKRTCSYCQRLGHYATGCPKRKVDESVAEKQ
ncbi:unnamed protein product [Lactuca saligna]|uniref:FAR1 domain-containing protein n=1 Tax=Lactuca saligna TaxID=75948 RepID=A0AA35VXK7_LACSI|nr:unnamed protein product [Lactuca saligna]